MPYIIYRITNKVNSKSYVGKTTKSLQERFQKHVYNCKAGSNTYLYKAMRRYGIETFTAEVLEETTYDQLNDQESFWILKLSPEYNMTSGGDGGDTSTSPNFKKSMELYHKNKPREEYATYGMLGKPCKTKGQPNRKLHCPVICEGKMYESVGSAQNAYPGINVRKRLDNPKYPEFYRLREKTCRK
jgi:group I intron endonuclease